MRRTPLTIAPTFEVFTGAQLLTRALVNTALIVAGIAAIEDAPEGARAFATGMYALALGAGFGLAVVLLPLADLGDYGWRISFAVSAAFVVLVPVIARLEGDAAIRAEGAVEARRERAPPRESSIPRTGSASCCSGWPRSSPMCSARRRHSSPTATSPTPTTSRTPTSPCSVR